MAIGDVRCAVILKRWAALTGDQPVLEKMGATIELVKAECASAAAPSAT